ncbi:MAG: mechanosensitive ion channel [candidate division Zixibacteria bacterium]|nr:mechanosensitive ion channel [candidate division Zixibacteria bacterium]NIR65508.1 mechanosensitive ion channel [candidate division Zixibacteria bacterium]NIS15480.1 mechanosensitive ion channel [candidate division Zixibacteria bacterium]NIS47194.1 mechanosensitive ion channel [candidate division Zixibacteria bacterium]NIT51999.1 mechanosensitive ion channel [candidate division Zixibacteria bacterium]
MVESLQNWLIDLGLSESLSLYLKWILLSIGVILLAYISSYVTRSILLVALSRFIKRTRTRWDDALLQRRFFRRLSQFAPAIVIYLCAPLFPPIEDLITRLAYVYMVLVGLRTLGAFLNAVNDIYITYDISKQKPIKGYLQVAQIIAAAFAILIIIAALFNRSVWPLLTGLGAMTAVIILVFKDSILGLVASVQLTNNDMVRIGDWIEMPKYGADGDVIDVTLTTVKVQNWDKTITTIPAYALIADSFKNWRGMQESGGRRIKRAVYIDMSSIKFVNPAMLERFKKYQLIKDYLESKEKEIAEYNREHDIDTSELINGRNLTNIGTFRAYIIAYLKNHPMVRNDMTFLVRHLPPGPTGLPIEIYVFSKDQVWANYEAIQADIFDHILAVVPLFDLRVFQNPTGNDFRELSRIRY